MIVDRYFVQYVMVYSSGSCVYRVFWTEVQDEGYSCSNEIKYTHLLIIYKYTSLYLFEFFLHHI